MQLLDLLEGGMAARLRAEHFMLPSRGDLLSDYQFGKKRIHHLFCPGCGIHSFGGGVGPDGREMRAVNVRCLENVDVEALTIAPFDGKSL